MEAQAQTSSSASTSIFIGPSSPLLVYKPERNGPSGSGWSQDDSGYSSCGGQGTFSLELDAFYFSQIIFIWVATSSYTINVGIDGSMSSGSASTGTVTLTSTFGAHSVRLEASAAVSADGTALAEGDIFQFMGVRVVTQVTSSGHGTNTTLDDASSQITYTGFATESTKQSTIPAIQSGDFYGDTLSYTSTAGATASWSFTGSALYIFGPTGPTFGIYSITIDSTSMGTFNASSTITTYHTLLFFTTHLDGSQTHQVVMRNEVDGGLVALDYVVIASPAGGVGSSSPKPVGAPGNSNPVTTAVPVPGPVNAPSLVTVPVPGTTMVQPGTYPSQSTYPGNNNGVARGASGATGAIVGGIIGGLLALLLLWLFYRYYKYRKAGGKGDFCTALFGACFGPAKPVDKPKGEKFILWPMVSSKPKYAT